MPYRGRTTHRSKRSRVVSPSKSRSRSASAIVRAPARRPGGYLWGPTNYWSKYNDPFPSKAHYVLRYSDSFTMNAPVGGSSVYHFRATSIYDPDKSGVGHQPYGHDTLKNIYNHYIVDKAVCTVVPTQFGNTACTYGMRIDDNATNAASWYSIRETKGTTVAVTAVGAAPSPISRTWNRSKVFPVEKSTVAGFGNDPTENSFFSIFCQGPNLATDPGSVDFMVNITYYVTCFELQDLNQS